MIVSTVSVVTDGIGNFLLFSGIHETKFNVMHPLK